MIAILSTVVSILAFRLRSRASLELELIALRHQVSVLRRKHPGRLRLFSTDRLLWMWLYRVWPQVLNAMVLVKPATVVQWHRKGFRLCWRWRSRRLGRPKVSTEIRDLIRQMGLANPLWGAPRNRSEIYEANPTTAHHRDSRTRRRDQPQSMPLDVHQQAGQPYLRSGAHGRPRGNFVPNTAETI